MGSVDYRYAYAGESAIESAGGGQSVRLATSGGVTDREEQRESANPFFFQGALTEPRVTALGLTVLSRVVASRFTMTQGDLLAMRDPVVTCGGGLLRFEGFSGCCGVYGRLDLNPEAYDGLVAAQGTTNVDFNAEMRGALARIGDRESVSLAVGDEEVTLLRGSEQIVERKVKLPLRWLKGFVEVQAYKARMKRRVELDRVAGVRLLRSIPRGIKGNSPVWLTSAGRTVRFGRSATKGAVKVSGLERLRLIEELAPVMKGLRIYAEEDGETSVWEADLGRQLFSLALSPDNYRGFSGEGQVLNDLAKTRAESLLEQTRQSLKWQAELRPEEFATSWDVESGVVRAALGLLGSRGLVGFDLARNAYFHREMPFDMSRAEAMHPRLKGAKQLIEEKKVSLVSNERGSVVAGVAGSDVTHRVEIAGDDQRCTCQWHTKYLGSRGPCKHILAVQMATGVDEF